MLRKWMEFERCSPPLIFHLWWLFKGLRCFWRTIFILSHWKLNKGYYEEALWILLGRRFCRLICKSVVTKYIFRLTKRFFLLISWWNLYKYISPFLTNTFTILTNTFYNFVKYNLQFGQIHFAVELSLAPWPEDISRWYLFMSLLTPRWLERRRLFLCFPFPHYQSNSPVLNMTKTSRESQILYSVLFDVDRPTYT